MLLISVHANAPVCSYHGKEDEKERVQKVGMKEKKEESHKTVPVLFHQASQDVPSLEWFSKMT